MQAVAVSADGRRAVSGGYDGTVRVWDLGSSEPPDPLTGHDLGEADRRFPDQDLPGLALPPDRPPPRQAARPGRGCNSLLVIAWHLLSDPDARVTDLGAGWHDRLTPLCRKRQLIAELERLSGKKVLLQEEAAA